MEVEQVPRWRRLNGDLLAATSERVRARLSAAVVPASDEVEGVRKKRSAGVSRTAADDHTGRPAVSHLILSVKPSPTLIAEFDLPS